MLRVLLLIVAATSLFSAASTAVEGGRAATGKGNILFVAPVSSKSHKIFYYGIIEAIAREGHKVTLLTPYKPSRSIPNVREVVYEENDISLIMANPFKDGSLTPILTITREGPEMCLSSLASEKTTDILKENFDLAFVSMFFAECYLGHLHAKEIPFVFVSPAEMFGPFTGLRMGNPTFSSFDMNPMVKFTAPYTFPERIVNVLLDVVLGVVFQYTTNRMDSLGRSQNLYPSDMPHLSSIFTNASLMIANSFRLAEHPRPYMPNILLAGGIHCKPPQPLPKELQDWVSDAGEAGVIYFSLGSAVRPSDVPDSTVRLLMSVFESLPQKVLWKYNLEDLKELPNNVRLTKWAPQQDLLGHPSMRLFISHGGVLSTQEATYHGVPVLGLPVFGDQEGNMNKAEMQGWGIRMSWDELTFDNLRTNIIRLIEDPEKRAIASQLGNLMRDRPSLPADDVAWWTGYLLRTRGAKHLRSGAADLPWYQLYNTDVWLMFVCCDLLCLWLLLKLLRFLWRCCCGGKTAAQTKKRKQQ